MFSKAFPKVVQGSNYPVWQEVRLTDDEETLEDKKCRWDNVRIMKESLKDAAKMIKDKDYEDYERFVAPIAMHLFMKRASHVVYWKETKAKEKFDKLFC